jgi:histidinol dehydrogenase
MKHSGMKFRNAFLKNNARIVNTIAELTGSAFNASRASMDISVFKGLEPYLEQHTQPISDEVSKTVSQILKKVRKNGDKALRRYSRRFDKVEVNKFLVSEQDQQKALDSIDSRFQKVLIQATNNIRKFHERQKTETQLKRDQDGTILGWKVTPIDCVGIYVPGGRAVYPSSVLMNVVPAQVAGVPRIAIVTPPGKNGLPHPLIMASARLLNVNELYSVGGAQAIGALAYGTESIAPVYKITGPGNAYVAEAKRQVFGTVGIDSFAGPSEITIICDRKDAPVEYLVRDMLSQAEHDPNARALLITTSQKQANAVAKRLEELIPTLPKKEIISASFSKNSAIVVIKSLKKIFDAVNEIAPEHLEVITKNPLNDLNKIRNAGAIFLGMETPEPVGDYFAGPNHTLPTSRCARFSSPLGVQDFVKNSSVLMYSKERLQREASSIIRFAKEEALFAHAAAIQVRVKS